jgi:predicted Zn-dependent protease
VREAPEALALAERARAAASGDAVDVLVQSERSGFARFASSVVHQPTLVEDATVTVRVLRDGKVGSVSTNRTDDEGLREAAERAGRAADLSRPDPGFPGLAPPAEPPGVEGWDAETAELGPEGLAERAWSAIEGARDLGLYGYVTAGLTEIAVSSSTGLAVSQALTDATVVALAAGEGLSGYANATSSAIGGLDPAGTGREAAELAARTRNAGELQAGTYRAVLSPVAFGELVWYFGWSSLGALSLLEGRSYVAGRMGERLFSERFQLRDDGLDPAGLPKAFDLEGVPKRQVTLVEDGVVRDVVWDRRTGKRAGRESTGHALAPAAQAYGPLPFNLVVAPGDSTDEELAELVGDGIYVTRLHYVNVVDGREGVFTGMTRDGTFLIEGGRITKPLANLRFSTSFPELAATLLGLGRDVRLVNASDFYDERYPYGSRVPAVATERFTITGTGSGPGL